MFYKIQHRGLCVGNRGVVFQFVWSPDIQVGNWGDPVAMQARHAGVLCSRTVSVTLHIATVSSGLSATDLELQDPV